MQTSPRIFIGTKSFDGFGGGARPVTTDETDGNLCRTTRMSAAGTICGITFAFSEGSDDCTALEGSKLLSRFDLATPA